jgi:hypothetical protein
VGYRSSSPCRFATICKHMGGCGQSVPNAAAINGREPPPDKAVKATRSYEPLRVPRHWSRWCPPNKVPSGVRPGPWRQEVGDLIVSSSGRVPMAVETRFRRGRSLAGLRYASRQDCRKTRGDLRIRPNRSAYWRPVRLTDRANAGFAVSSAWVDSPRRVRASSRAKRDRFPAPNRCPPAHHTARRGRVGGASKYTNAHSAAR